MDLGCALPEYWFNSYTTQQYRHYLRVKSYSEYAHGVYETLYTTQNSEATAPSVKEKITIGKKSLRMANALRREAGDFPAHLRHLMKLDWEYCISSCIAIHEYIEGNSKSELQLIPLLSNYISEKSQYVGENDLDIILGKSNYAFGQIARSIIKQRGIDTNECLRKLDKARKSVDLDLETMIKQIKAMVNHSRLDDPDNTSSISLVKIYDDRFGMQRKAIQYLSSLLSVSERPEENGTIENLNAINDGDQIIKRLNELDRNLSRFMIIKLTQKTDEQDTD